MTILQGNSTFPSWEGDASAVHRGLIPCQQCRSALCCQKEAGRQLQYPDGRVAINSESTKLLGTFNL